MDAERDFLIEEMVNEEVTRQIKYYVEAESEAEIHEELRKATRSLYGLLLREIGQTAARYTLEENFGPSRVKDKIRESFSLVDTLRNAFVQDWSDKELNFWDNATQPFDRIRKDDVPYIDRDSLEGAVGDYLSLPYRSSVVDRFLVKTLIAMEAYAYGDEMFNEKTFGLGPARSPLKKRHVLLGYLLGQVANGILFGGIAALALWLSSEGWINASLGGWLAAIFAALYLLLLAFSTAILPFAWFKLAKDRRRVGTLLSTMLTIYNELRSSGPISARYVRRRAEAADALGVSWPAPLFALLDDIVSRTGRF